METFFKRVSVREELPEKSGYYNINIQGHKKYGEVELPFAFFKKDAAIWIRLGKELEPTHWLKPLPILSRDKMDTLRSFWDNAYSAGCEDQLHNRVGKDCEKKFKEDIELCNVLSPTISRDKMIEIIKKTLYPLKLKDDVLNSLADAILKSGLPEKKIESIKKRCEDDYKKAKTVEIKKDGSNYYLCPKCEDSMIIAETNFCPSCGSKILWK